MVILVDCGDQVTSEGDGPPTLLCASELVIEVAGAAFVAADVACAC
jgi:hypothetical protein